MAVEAPRTYADVNAVVGGYLRDLAFAQSSQQKMFGYKRAANAILVVGPATDRPAWTRRGSAANSWNRTGFDARDPRDPRDRRLADRRTGRRTKRPSRRHRATTDPAATLSEPRGGAAGARGSRLRRPHGRAVLAAICKCTPNGAMVLRRSRRLPTACVARGYQYAAVTDHSYGLRIAGGMSMAEAAAQRLAIDGVNARYGGRFRTVARHRGEHRRGRSARSDRRRGGHLRSGAGGATLQAAEDRRSDGSHAHRSSAPGGSDSGAPARPNLRLAGGRHRELGGRVRGRRASVAWRSKSTAIPRDRTWISRSDGRHYRSAVSLRSTATHTPLASCPMPKPHWRTHGWPLFPPTESSTAGRWSDCWPGCRIRRPSAVVEQETFMPFKSQAQRRKFAQLLVDGKISNETFEEWNRETGRKKLPERIGTPGRAVSTKAKTPRKSRAAKKR